MSAKKNKATKTAKLSPQHEALKKMFGVKNNKGKFVSIKMMEGRATQRAIRDTPSNVANIAKRVAKYGISQERVDRHVDFHSKPQPRHANPILTIGKNGVISLSDFAMQSKDSYALGETVAEVNSKQGLRKRSKPHESDGRANDSRRGRTKLAPVDSYPDDVPVSEEYTERAVERVLVNRYERRPDAKAACLRAFGNTYTCDVCRMSFRKKYGDIGEDYIHVHHRKPRALHKNGYQIKPKTDLVPVCPNCHAMLHHGRPWHSPRTTDELSDILRKQRKRKQNS